MATRTPGNTLHVKVVTAEGELYSGEATMVSAPGAEGQLGILPRHAALLTFLKRGALRIELHEAEEPIYVTGGCLEVCNNRVNCAESRLEHLPMLPSTPRVLIRPAPKLHAVPLRNVSRKHNLILSAVRLWASWSTLSVAYVWRNWLAVGDGDAFKCRVRRRICRGGKGRKSKREGIWCCRMSSLFLCYRKVWQVEERCDLSQYSVRFHAALQAP